MLKVCFITNFLSILFQGFRIIFILFLFNSFCTR